MKRKKTLALLTRPHYYYNDLCLSAFAVIEWNSATGCLLFLKPGCVHRNAQYI